MLKLVTLDENVSRLLLTAAIKFEILATYLYIYTLFVLSSPPNTLSFSVLSRRTRKWEKK